MVARERCFPGQGRCSGRRGAGECSLFSGDLQRDVDACVHSCLQLAARRALGRVWVCSICGPVGASGVTRDPEHGS